ncbi:MAG: ABC transporter ATP-binding protein [Myxococcota bacterium]
MTRWRAWLGAGVIRVEHLTKRYGAHTAVRDLGFEVARGEVVGFLGPNGAGKTTTMRILTGSLGATEGRALIGGIDVLEQPRAVKRIVGYLPEVPPLYTEMTVDGFLRFCARIKGAKEPAAAVDRAVERTGLGKVRHRLIEHLSKGFRQRVGVAQALVHDPQVLILDEPTSGLDPAQRVEIRNLIASLAGDITVVLSTHVLAEVEAVANRVIIVNHGRIVAQETMEGLHGMHHGVRLRVARPGPGLGEALRGIEGIDGVAVGEDGVVAVDASRDVREQVAAAAVPFGLLELGRRHALEDVFLQLTRESAQDPADLETA